MKPPTESAQPRLTELFNYAHVRPVSRSGCFRRLCLVVYAPFGLAIALARAVILLLLCIGLWLAPKRFFFPPLAARLFGLLFGVVLRYRVKSGDGSHAALREMFAKHRPLLLTSNHCTAFDVVPFLFLHPVNVLLDKGFFELVRSTFQKVVGAIPLDQSRKHEGDGRDTMRASIVSQLQASKHPLLFFPEGWDTSGNRGLLVYNKFLFSLGIPVVPVALRAYVPFFPIEPGVLGVTLWKEFVWLLCYPVLVWELTFLPPQTKGKQESDADFARRVQVMTAAELGSHVSPTSYLNKDALRLRLALLRDPPLRAKLLNGQFDVRWEEESKAS